MNSSSLAVGKLLFNTVGNNITSSKNKQTKKDSLLSLTSVDNLSKTNNKSTKTETKKSFNYTISRLIYRQSNETSVKTSQNAKDIPVNKEFTKQINENKNKIKSIINESNIKTSTSDNIIHFLPIEESTKSNLPSRGNLTIEPENVKTQPKPENSTQLINSKIPTLQPFFNLTSVNLPKTENIIKQTINYSPLKPVPLDEKVISTNPQKISDQSSKNASLKKITTDTQTSPIVTKSSTKITIANPVVNKTDTPGLNIISAQGKLIDAEQKVLTTSGNSSLSNDKPTDSETLLKGSVNKAIDDITSGKSTKSKKINTSYNRLDEIDIHKLSEEKIQVNIAQNKDLNGFTSNNNGNTDIEQLLSSNHIQSSISERLSNNNEMVNTSDKQGLISQDGISDSISQQVTESIRASIQQADRYITIRLEPPDLGSVIIKFKEHEKEITGLLEVSKAQTRYEIEKAVPQIIRTLADCGVQIKRLDVQLSDLSEQQADKNYTGTSLEDGSFQNKHFTQGDDSSGNNPGEWIPNSTEDTYQNYPETQLESSIHTSHESINILI
ncbi:MAG: hypothetical protein A2173_07060 [Planctomycetes bacterium RBG_13_44_8b]|nr:MAG: hypothetical protein A2173_07060 [Planctomycetes bacterium RBG_13_44_8b]